MIGSMKSIEATVFFVVTLIIGFTSADIFYNNTVLPGAPIYFGARPFIHYGNISGVLTIANATNAKGNIVLCPTFTSPVESMLLWCIQNEPSAVIAVFPPAGKARQVYLGRSMYGNIGMSYYSVPEVLRQTHIIEIDQADYITLATGLAIDPLLPAIVDGSSDNPWLDAEEGAATILYQVTAFFASAYVVYLCVMALRQAYLTNTIQKNLKTVVTFNNLFGCALRALYVACGPTGTRRLLSSNNDFIFTTLVLTSVVTSLMLCSVSWLESLTSKSLRINLFFSSLWTKLVVGCVAGIWVIYLFVLYTLTYFPHVSPLATGLSTWALILLQVIFLGACALIYTGISIVMFVKINRTKGMKSRRVFRTLYLTLTSVFAWTLFIVTICAMTPLWQIPYFAILTQWWCYLAQPAIQGLQQKSFETMSSGDSSKTNGTRSRTKSTGQTSSHHTSSNNNATSSSITLDTVAAV